MKKEKEYLKTLFFFFEVSGPLKKDYIYIYILKKQIFFPFKKSFGQQFFLKKTDFFFPVKRVLKKIFILFFKTTFFTLKNIFF